MDTTIGYLHEVREDLLDAAWRSTLRSPAPRRWRRPSRRWAIALISTVTVVAAGLTGWIVTRPEGGLLARNAALPGSARHPTAGASTAPAPETQRNAFAPSAGGQPGNEAALGGFEASGGAGATRGAETILLPDLARIVKTASLTVVVGRDDFGTRFQDAMDVASRVGGYIETSSTRGTRSGGLVMRVPAARFEDAMAALRRLGRVQGQRIAGRDVTAQYVDLSARIRISRARLHVLLGLMQKAVTIEQTIRVQNALDDVQLRIEELQGQLNVLNDQTAKATIRLQMREEGVEPPTTAAVENPSISHGWDRAIAGFFGVVVAVIVGLGYVLPVAALVLLVGLLVWRVRHWRAA